MLPIVKHIKEIQNPENHQKESQNDQQKSKGSFNLSFPAIGFVICVFEIEHTREKEGNLKNNKFI